jgi:hypothetical protein
MPVTPISTEPTPAMVLGWLAQDTSRTTKEAVAQWWPGVTDADRVRALNTKIRVWIHRERAKQKQPKPRKRTPKPKPPPKPALPTPPPRGERPPPPAPPPRERPEGSLSAATDRVAWMAGELDALGLDIQTARRSGRWDDVTKLTKAAREMAAALDEARRVPPPTEAPPETPRPLLSDEALVDLDADRLRAVICGLMGVEVPTDDDVIAAMQNERMAVAG